MEGDIEFGDVQHSQPKSARRPDEDLHFAVAAYGQPAEGELPVFVDLDVVREIEDHASADTSVELGGVLLGGQYEDADGKAFVVITDCLRAQHYESTKGSFKFTHETWSAISRQRDEFPEELQMVGWYHTHPDWGVFLSGMDMFICDHFFNRPLDVAYVVDPCRGDRGMFQWTRDARQRTRRTAGFYVTTSRFREEELQFYLEQLQQKGPSMPVSHSGSGAPIVHISQPHPPAWQGVAVWGTLVGQFCLLALIAWRMLGPAQDLTSNAGPGSTRESAQQSERDAVRQVEFVDHVLRELRGTEEGFAQRMEQEFSRTQELEELLQNEQRQNLAVVREIDRSNKAAFQRIENLEEHLALKEKKLAAVTADKEELLAEFAALEKTRLAKGKKTRDGATAAEDDSGFWSYVVGGSVGAAALACLVLGMLWRKRGQSLNDGDELSDALRAGEGDNSDPPSSPDDAAGTSEQPSALRGRRPTATRSSRETTP